MTLAVKVALNPNTNRRTKLQILDSSILKEFADTNFKYDENGKFSKWVENALGKGKIAC